MSFIHVTFLAAALAIAVPILLHLNKRRKYLRIRLGSLQFLEPLVRRRRRMGRVEQWPLLLLRCLALLLLALLFARPYLRRPGPPPVHHGEVLFLLDASGSITPAQAGEIRKQAASLISALGPEDRAVLAAVSDRVAVLKSLDDYHPIPGSAGNVSAAVDWVVDRSAASPGVVAATHWFTDLQRAGLPSAPERLWPSHVTAAIHPVKAEAPHNVSVDQVEMLSPYNSSDWEIQARVRVFGDPSPSPMSVRLTTAGGEIAAATTSPAGGPVVFKFPGAAKNGVISGTVMVEDARDAWPADDSRPFAFPTERAKQIALVDGHPGTSRFTSESYFLEKALHSSSGGMALSPFRAKVITGIPALNPELDAIALCDLTSLTEAQIQLLKSHVNAGVGLAVFMGNRTNAVSWSRVSDAGLIPSGLRGLPAGTTAYLRHVDLDHPALAGVTRESLGSLQLMPLQHHVSWAAAPNWPTVMSFDDDTPLLTISPNRVAVLAQQVNREGSQFPLGPAFVPIMQGLFKQIAARPLSAIPIASIRQVHPGLDESRSPMVDPGEKEITVVSAVPEESDFTAVDEPAFRQALGVVDPGKSTESPAPVTGPEAGNLREGELWPWLVAVLLVLLAIESAAAMRPLGTPAPEVHAD